MLPACAVYGTGRQVTRFQHLSDGPIRTGYGPVFLLLMPSATENRFDHRYPLDFRL